MSYEVQTPIFEGPFDLLLHLILREQVDLYEVTLKTIVDGYIVQLEKMEDLDLEVATEFLLIAATLVELKSRRLLPEEDDGDLDDELQLWEERDLLLSRLVECKTFKDAAVVLEQLANNAARRFPRRAGIDDRFIDLTPDPLEGVTPVALREAFFRAIEPPATPKVELEHVAPIRASVVDAIAEIADELRASGRLTFRQLTAGFTVKLDLVVRFLAILEMYKLGIVDLEQVERFGDIEVGWIGDEDLLDEGLSENALVAIDAYEG